MELRARRRDRAARNGVELFLYERVFADCLDRLALVQRRFENALLMGCPDPEWPARLKDRASHVDVRDPGPLFAAAAGGEAIIEDRSSPPRGASDLVVAIGTLDTVNDLPLALRLIVEAMAEDAMLIGAISGGETLPMLRGAMRAADAVSGVAAPHVHPRIEAAALAPLLSGAGLAMPVVDVDRVEVGYRSFERLVGDLRAMAATNILAQRPARSLGRRELLAAKQAFEESAIDGRTPEAFEILHFSAWKNRGARG
jgi:hypothetical protein